MNTSLSHFLKIKESIAKQPFARRNYSSQPNNPLAYLRYRLLRPYLKWRYNKYQKTNPNEPWLCPDAIKALTSLLDKHDLGLEYGSGRSTTFFAPYFQKYISVEHHTEWYNKVKSNLTNLKLNQVDYKLIPAEQEVPQQHLSSEQQAFISREEYPIGDELFSNYTDFILQFEASSFDFVLVDGRARRTCALNAIEKVKTHGLLVLDNSERRRYKEVHSALSNWPKIETTTGLTDTTIWIKP